MHQKWLNEFDHDRQSCLINPWALFQKQTFHQALAVEHIWAILVLFRYQSKNVVRDSENCLKGHLH